MTVIYSGDGIAFVPIDESGGCFTLMATKVSCVSGYRIPLDVTIKFCDLESTHIVSISDSEGKHHISVADAAKANGHLWISKNRYCAGEIA